MDELQQLLALMGVTSFAEAVAALTAINTTLTAERSALGTSNTTATLSALSGRSAQFAALEKATGKTGDEAVGVIRAALASHAELPKLTARLADLEKVERGNALAALFAQAEKDGKLTPGIKNEVQAAFDAGEVTLKGAESWLKNLLPVKALDASKANLEAAAPTPAVHERPVFKFKSKTWAELSADERHELLRTDAVLYDAMRSTAAS